MRIIPAASRRVPLRLAPARDSEDVTLGPTRQLQCHPEAPRFHDGVGSLIPSPLLDRFRLSPPEDIPARQRPDPLEISRRETLLDVISRVFTPSSPIRERELFAGRKGQIADLRWVIRQPGRHAVIFGERGVGKTSLARHLEQLVKSEGPKHDSTTVTCRRGHTFSEIWDKAFHGLGLFESRTTAGFSAAINDPQFRAGQWLGRGPEITPDSVVTVLRTLGQARRTVVFLDEFDRIADPNCRGQMADLLKLASDEGVPTTLVLVGVADSLEQLVAEHQSVERIVEQILMPRMSREELGEIVVQGLERLDFAIEAAALKRIVGLSHGIPTFTHLLAQEAAKAALDTQESRIEVRHVHVAARAAPRHVEHTVRNQYSKAAGGARPGKYPIVLLAAALCPGDELGYFTATEVRDGLDALSDEVPSARFNRHLDALCGEARGKVLEKFKDARPARYRFRNPLLQPYIVIRGSADGSVALSVLTRLAERALKQAA
jgi:Cdc6-like AAA superfamily ATPase